MTDLPAFWPHVSDVAAVISTSLLILSLLGHLAERIRTRTRTRTRQS